MEIKHSKTLSKTDAVPLVTEAAQLFYQLGYTPPNIVQFSGDDEIVYAVNEKKHQIVTTGKIKTTREIVGCITFVHADYMLQLNIKLGYVKKGFRRLGVHTAMSAKVREIAVERGCKCIFSMVSTENEEMHRHVLKLGRKPFGTWYIEELKVDE